MERTEERIEQAANLVVESQRIIVFTGAGVSTESGIPDFRSPGGIWSRYDPDDFTIQKFLSDKKARKRHWDLLMGGELMITRAEPNPAHYAIAELEKMGKLYGVITQNVDGLHQKAGVSADKVFQLHGNLSRAKCLSCGKSYLMEEVTKWLREETDEPECRACKGMLKPDAVFFGESLPFEVLMESERRARSCDVCFVIGSSLVVYPAALMPMYALEGGAKLVIINVGSTQMDALAQIRIEGKAGEIIPPIIEKAKDKLGMD